MRQIIYQGDFTAFAEGTAIARGSMFIQTLSFIPIGII